MVTVEMRITARHWKRPDVHQQGNLMCLEDPGKGGKIAGRMADGVDDCHIHDCRGWFTPDENLKWRTIIVWNLAKRRDFLGLGAEYFLPFLAEAVVLVLNVVVGHSGNIVTDDPVQRPMQQLFLV